MGYLTMARNDAAQLLDEAHRLGFDVRRNGDRLHVEGPESESWFVAKLAEAKPAILAALDRPHCIVLRAEPYPDETDAADPVDGRRIVAVVESHGGTLTIERHGIALRWTGHMPDAGAIIGRIRANRTGVVAALNKATSPGQ